MFNYDEEMLKLCERKAEDGNGQFAIAYAILRPTRETSELRADLCFGPSNGRVPGVLEKLAMGVDDLAKNVGEIADNSCRD